MHEHDQRIKEIRERLEAATPGPWYKGDKWEPAYEYGHGNMVLYEESPGYCASICRQDVYTPSDNHPDAYDRQVYANIRLIANAPADIAYLLEALASEKIKTAALKNAILAKMEKPCLLCKRYKSRNPSWEICDTCNGWQFDYERFAPEEAAHVDN